MRRVQLNEIDLTIEPRRVLVIALARSGYHAVMHWICCKIPGLVVFYNNCNHLLQHRDKLVYSNGILNQKTHIYSFENFDLRGFKDLNLQGAFDQIIIVNRDPYNWIASSMQKGQKLGVLSVPVPTSKVLEYSKWTCQSMSRIDMFKQYMRQCLGEEDLLGEPFLHINYNKWFSDVKYRKGLCRRLKVKFSDAGLDYVPLRGGGSSFDHQKYQGDGHSMDVLNRWRKYKNNKRYNKLLTEDIKEYSRKYFNFNPL